MATDSLFKLIKTMTTGEKIHFKRSSNKKSEGKNASYLLLFDIMDGLKVYDKKVVEKKLEAKKIKFNYNETKNYLYGLLIDFFEHNNSESTLSLRATRLLKISQIMFEKGLYEDAWEYLKKTKEIAEKYEMYEMLLQIHSHELNLVWDHKENDRLSSVEKIISKKRELINNVSIINQYHEITYLIVLLNAEEASSKDKEILEQAGILYGKMQYLPETKLFYPNFMKHFSSILFFYITQDFAKIKEHCSQIINLCRQNPDMARRFNSHYYSVLEQYLTALHFYNEYVNYNTILEWFYEIRGHLEKHIQPGAALFKETLGLDILITKGEVELANKHLLSAPKNFVPSSNVLIIERQYKLILKYACVSFFSRQFKEAQKYIQKILDEFNLKSETLVQVHYAAKIMQLLITYERNDYMMLNDLIQSTQKYFLRHQKLQELEVIMFNLFRRLLKNELDKLAWEETKDKINVFDPCFLHEYFGFDIISWIDSKIQKRPVEDILKEKALKYYPEIFNVEIEC